MSGPRFDPNLIKTPVYIAGKSVEEVKEELGLAEVIKLPLTNARLAPHRWLWKRPFA